MASVVLNAQALREALEGPGGLVYRDVLRRSNRVLNSARRNCPTDEGRLKASLAMEIRTEGTAVVGRVGTNLTYALYVHEGTGIFAGKGYIVPVRARVLAWPVKNNQGGSPRRYRGGKTAEYAFAKRVKGVPGRPFLRNALDAEAMRP